jgi:hypothetical protein
MAIHPAWEEFHSCAGCIFIALIKKYIYGTGYFAVVYVKENSTLTFSKGQFTHIRLLSGCHFG